MTGGQVRNGPARGVSEVGPIAAEALFRRWLAAQRRARFISLLTSFMQVTVSWAERRGQMKNFTPLARFHWLPHSIRGSRR
jgi:hypothetical protein